MSDNTQNIDVKIATKKLTIKQLEAQLKRDEKESQKAREKLLKQIEREKTKARNTQARKLRNKKIYDWGGLFPLVFGTEEFDRFADDYDMKCTLIGILLHAKHKLQTEGLGLTNENKPTILETCKNNGKQFLAERNKR